MGEPQITAEQLLNQLREMYGPGPQIIVDIRDCGTETRSPNGKIEYGAQIGMNGEQFEAKTIAGVLRKVRKWKESQQS